MLLDSLHAAFAPPALFLLTVSLSFAGILVLSLAIELFEGGEWPR
jgi:hypothetical protein